MLDLGTVSDELLPNSLVRNLSTAHMNENGERSLARDDSVAAQVYLVNHLPRNITSLVEKYGNLVRKPKQQYLPLRLNLLDTSDSTIDDYREPRLYGSISLM